MTKEAESGRTSGMKIPCSRTSNGTTVRLQKDQYVYWLITVQSSCQMRVLDIVYMNGSHMDEVTVYADDERIGSFTISLQSHSGNFCDQTKSSGPLYNAINLSVGFHSVKVVATVVDEFGIGIDKALLGFVCALDEDEVCPKVTPDDGLSRGEIFGIVFFIVSFVAACIGCCFTIYCGQKKYNCCSCS